MKLKELPASLLRAWQLKRIPLGALISANEKTIPVVVSLTSIPSRLHLVHLTIRSILSQTARPEKVVLWLNEKLKSILPRSLTELQSDIFEIGYVDLNCSHRKLIHSLEKFPEKIIVTTDDDLLYDPDWLKTLYQEHVQYPDQIIGHECRKINYGSDGKVLPYHQWRLMADDPLDHPAVLAIGYGGVLYPPHALHNEVKNSELFLRLAPKADDLWFKVMAIKKGTSVRKLSKKIKRALPIAGSQKFSLKKTNVRLDGNITQWQALVDYYQIPPFLD